MPIRERTHYLHTIKPWATKSGKQIHTPDKDRFLSLKQDVLTTSDLYSDGTFSVEALVSYLCACVCIFSSKAPRKITQDRRVHLPGTLSQHLWIFQRKAARTSSGPRERCADLNLNP